MQTTKSYDRVMRTSSLRSSCPTRTVNEVTTTAKSDFHQSHDCFLDEKHLSLVTKSRRYSFIFGEYIATKDEISREIKGIYTPRGCLSADTVFDGSSSPEKLPAIATRRSRDCSSFNMSSSSSPVTKRLSQITSGRNHINSPVSYPSATSPELNTTIASSASLSPSPHQTRASSPNSGLESSSDDYMDYRCNTLRNEVPCTFPVATRSADELQTDRNEMKHPVVSIDSERASFSSTFSSFTPYSTKSRPHLQARTCTSSEQMLARISTDNHASTELVPPIPKANMGISTKQLPRLPVFCGDLTPEVRKSTLSPLQDPTSQSNRKSQRDRDPSTSRHAPSPVSVQATPSPDRYTLSPHTFQPFPSSSRACSPMSHSELILASIQ